MAETAVGLLLDKLIPLLTEQANLLRGIHKEVDEIKRELQSILAVLKEADRRAELEGNNISDGVKVWVEELREAAFQIDDVIDEYTHLMAQQQSQYKHRFLGFLRKICCLIVELNPRCDIATKVQELKQMVREINERKATYGFSFTEQGFSTAAQSNSWYDPRNDSRFLRETEVVGIESARDELIGVLEGTGRTVISVVGMGGLGKTTLAQIVYDRAKGNFDCHAWIEVSQSYDKVKLLQDLINKIFQSRKETIPEEIGSMDVNTMTTKLRDYLQGKSYLVIFDDVWSIHFWDYMKNALLGNNEKSGRIIITTRLTEVANSCRKSSLVHIHPLQPLLPEKAWELFCNKTFQFEPEGNCPTYLEKLSHEIVERCQGLPLAIVVIAGLLSTKNKTIEEWRKLLTSLSSELESNEHLTSITNILSLSYSDLPYNLKPCFLYYGIFPEDYSIRAKRLFRQWIAEGFVKSKKDKKLEIVAEEYLAELINRNLVQVSEVDFDGKARTCRIHDLLREIILNKMEDLSFCQVLLSGKDSHFKGLTRRMSIINRTHDVIASCSSEISHVRSIFVFDKEEMPNHVVCAVTTNFKFLKVLDFEDAPNLDHLPKDIGSLFHLKYLSVRGTKVGMLPKSIGKLENLETLDMKESLVFELPAEIKRLSKLRYISAYHSDIDSFSNRKAVKVERGIGQLKALQKLFYIEASIEVDIFIELCKLTELRKLGITKLTSEDGKKLCDCIQKMNHLESLEIASISEDEIIDLESMTSPLFLRSLGLHGRLRKLPEWITNLQNLVRIVIRWSRLEEDPQKVLQKLPNLLELAIGDDGYYGETLHFKEGAFSKLKVLHLYLLSKLRLLVIEEGALCNLEKFIFGPCPQLKELPSGFQHLRKLKEVHLREISIKLLMFQNFQSLQSTGADIRFAYLIHGRCLNIKLERIMEIQKSMRDLDQEEWESKFANILRSYLRLYI